MPSWVNQIRPVTLYQSSDIPYVVKRKGIYLCFDNFYEQKPQRSDYTIEFTTDRKLLRRKTANHYMFKKFPIYIPFRDVVKANNIKDVDKITNLIPANKDAVTIMLITIDWLGGFSDDRLDDLLDDFSDYDSVLLLYGDEGLPAEIRKVFEHPKVDTLYHITWPRTCVAMANKFCESHIKGVDWTRTVPPLEVNYCGLEDQDDINGLNDNMIAIGVEHDIRWGG